MAGYLKKIWKTAALFLASTGIMVMVLWLYNCPDEPVLYGSLLCMALFAGAFVYGYFRFRSKAQVLSQIAKSIPLDLEKLPLPQDNNEAALQQMIHELNRMRMEAEEARMTSYREMADYYTMWVHQIKIPIAALRLLLGEQPQENKTALAEVFRVEEYVEMVLGYLRSEDMSSDMKFSECDLDKIIREQIHKYASVFIGKKLQLDYERTQEKVLTDPKWLGFVIGQCISNALKYTKTGEIRIYLSESRPHTLVIEDTGAGISAEDLPRIFEKGFTGYNGRTETRSSGIGLYLSRKIMKRLDHGISVESEPGKGTRVYLSLGRRRAEVF